MDPKWILVLALVVFYQKVSSGAYMVQTPSEGQEVDITCNPEEKGTMIMWFRVLKETGTQFIASFTVHGHPKTPLPPAFKYKMSQHTLTLNRFTHQDSGVYVCAALVKGNELKFGKATQLDARNAPPPAVTTRSPQVIRTTATPCACRTREENPATACPLVILGPLAGGCGLLLLLLIIITLYCNKIRTRRCPHHYKRKPRMMEPGKQLRPNSHV